MTETPTLYAIRRKADGVLMKTPGRRWRSTQHAGGKMTWQQPGHAKNACTQHWPVRLPHHRLWEHLKFAEQDVYEIVRVSLHVEEVVR